MSYKTIPISELERKNDHWFSEDNKRFFKSMWDSYALQNEGSIYAYFVSSEKHVSHFANINEPRKYTIRKFNMRNGELPSDEGIFDFQAFKDKRSAERELRKYLENEPIKEDKAKWLQSEIEHLEYIIKRTYEEIEELKKELEGVKA